MFYHPNLKKKVFGIVENMAWFTPEELPENKYYIFGKGGAAKLAAKYNLPVLAEIPLIQGVCDRGDAGIPVANDKNAAGDAFKDLAGKLISLLV